MLTYGVFGISGVLGWDSVYTQQFILYVSVPGYSDLYSFQQLVVGWLRCDVLISVWESWFGCSSGVISLDGWSYMSVGFWAFGCWRMVLLYIHILLYIIYYYYILYIIILYYYTYTYIYLFILSYTILFFCLLNSSHVLFLLLFISSHPSSPSALFFLTHHPFLLHPILSFSSNLPFFPFQILPSFSYPSPLPSVPYPHQSPLPFFPFFCSLICLLYYFEDLRFWCFDPACFIGVDGWGV